MPTDEFAAAIGGCVIGFVLAVIALSFWGGNDPKPAKPVVTISTCKDHDGFRTPSKDNPYDSNSEPTADGYLLFCKDGTVVRVKEDG